MLRNKTNKSKLKNLSYRSKSICCEKELKTLNIKFFKQQQNIKRLDKKPTNLNALHQNLNFIDDDDDDGIDENHECDNEVNNIINASNNESTSSLSSVDLNEDNNNGYNKNELSKSAPNSPTFGLINERDNETNDKLGSDQMIDIDEEFTKSKTLTRNIHMQQQQQNEAKYEKISFIYDMNLYNEQQNINLLNFKTQLDENQMRNERKSYLRDDDDDEYLIDYDLNNSDSDDFDDDEDVSYHNNNNNKSIKRVCETIKEEEDEDEELSISSTSTSTSSCISTTRTDEESESSLRSLHKFIQLEPLEIKEKSPNKANTSKTDDDTTTSNKFVVISPLTSTASSLLKDDNKQVEADQPVEHMTKTTNSNDSLKDIDVDTDELLVNDNTVVVIENEEKRLQEIINICMEYQINEQNKQQKQQSQDSSQSSTTSITSTNMSSSRNSLLNLSNNSFNRNTKQSPAVPLAVQLDKTEQPTVASSCVPAINQLINKLNKQKHLNGITNINQNNNNNHHLSLPSGSMINNEFIQQPKSNDFNHSNNAYFKSFSQQNLGRSYPANEDANNSKLQYLSGQLTSLTGQATSLTSPTSTPTQPLTSSLQTLSPVTSTTSSTSSTTVSANNNNNNNNNNTSANIRINVKLLNNLYKERCNSIGILNNLKQQIRDIEMRQKEAIRNLEIERALIDVEHNNELKKMHNDEFKLKNLQQEHQICIDTFNMHSIKLRKEIELAKETMKKIEYEIELLDSTLDSVNNLNDKEHVENIKKVKKHLLDESKHKHEDLEFQLMELEAKYESELEDIQNRLVYEQDNLLNIFKQRQVNLKEYDTQQTQMLEQVKEETEYLEQERQKLIDLFKKEKLQLELIEKKIQKLEQTNSPSPGLNIITTGSIRKSNSDETSPILNNKSHNSIQNYTLPRDNKTSMNDCFEIIENKLTNKSLNNTLNETNMSNMSIVSANPLVYKFAELEHTLAVTKAENHALLEQQLKTRERELHLLHDERRKREELEQKLLSEITMKEKILEENIKLRDKKQTQARPLTRYLPIRDCNFDLRQHVENSGHQLDAQVKNIQITKQTCRGYLFKMGQRFKTWNKRWFVFDRSKRTLSFYTDRNETKLRGTIYFQSINEVYVDHQRTIKSPDSKATFVVKTLDRNFYLVAPSPEAMRVWVDVIFTGAEGYLDLY